MRPADGLKGYSAFMDDDSGTFSLVSGRLTGALSAHEEEADFRAPRNAEEAQKKSELQSLLLMASLMLGEGTAIV